MVRPCQACNHDHPTGWLYCVNAPDYSFDPADDRYDVRMWRERAEFWKERYEEADAAHDIAFDQAVEAKYDLYHMTIERDHAQDVAIDLNTQLEKLRTLCQQQTKKEKP
jgi:hypothetical protein